MSRVRITLAGVAIIAGVLALPVAGAVSRFTDVADDNVFAGDIEWLADTGITRGCGPDTFCPDRAVTRQQMAAFLHRLSDAGIVDAASAGRADRATVADTATEADHATTADHATSAGDTERVGGRLAAGLDVFLVADATAAADQSTYTTVGATGSTLAEVEFVAAADGAMGVFTASASVLSLNSIDPLRVTVWIEFDDGTCVDYIAAEPAAFRHLDVPPSQFEEVGITAGIDIGAEGAHSAALCAYTFGGDVSVVSTALTGVVSYSPNNLNTITINPA